MSNSQSRSLSPQKGLESDTLSSQEETDYSDSDEILESVTVRTEQTILSDSVLPQNRMNVVGVKRKAEEMTQAAAPTIRGPPSIGILTRILSRRGSGVPTEETNLALKQRKKMKERRTVLVHNIGTEVQVEEDNIINLQAQISTLRLQIREEREKNQRMRKLFRSFWQKLIQEWGGDLRADEKAISTFRT